MQSFVRVANPARPIEIRALTGVRGVAALYVVAYHLDLGQQNIGLLQHILHHGYLSVDLFFVLSGFVLALTSQRLITGPITLPAMRSFIGRRIARIYPLYLCSVLFCLWHQGFALDRSPLSFAYWKEMVSNLLLMQAWGLAPSINGVAWSISTELLAYLLFPVLVWGALRGSVRRSLLVALCCAAGLAVLCVAPRGLLIGGAMSPQGPLDYAEPTSFGPILRCLTEFTAGLLTFRLARTDVLSGLLRSPVFGPAVLMVALGLLALRGDDLAFVIWLPLVVLVLSTDTGPAAWLFKTPLVHRLGVLSYGIYLLHPLIIWPWIDMLRLDLFADHVPQVRLVTVIVAFAASLAVASLGYKYIECPARERLRVVF